MSEEIKSRKSFWRDTSSKTTFILGLISGIAFFGLISFIVLEVAVLTRPVNLSETPAGALSGVKVEEEIEEPEEEPPSPPPQPQGPTVAGSLTSFQEAEGEICKDAGKPIVRLFTTTWCPHCVWIQETFDSVVKEYVRAGKIVAHHWELDTGDDSLTAEKETGAPASEEAIYRKFNPRGSIPTFVFGCKYFRIGNAHEREQDLEAEAADFRAVIEELLK